MGITQRYQAAVVGHKKPLLSLAKAEKAEALRRPESEYRFLMVSARLLGAVLLSVLAAFAAFFALPSPRMGTFSFYGGEMCETGCLFPMPSCGELSVLCGCHWLWCGDSASCLPDGGGSLFRYILLSASRSKGNPEYRTASAGLCDHCSRESPL